MAIRANLIIDQGADYTTTVTLTDSDDGAISLAGYVASAQMRKTYSSRNAVDFTATISPTRGAVTISLTDAQTANIVPGRYVYDVILTRNGVTTRIIEGVATVTPRVTK